ncbi:MAG: hypothetical protein A2Z99_11960 [Treponema sp. GWB1_62_6]|nr:MAG: hypothetical protein A2Y36_16335 [Treponema sp. GWA1_62_8]OHE67351.1 MAG: hypothetical protein A2Z99_11960 [Treponema sp. GWB1_62_6]OHE67504.1 MAG: hypothetical protein A2001_14345 [Treponema sp. GWC1_61_84]HCM26071.1 hypothetical protein [Treponema sp.]
MDYALSTMWAVKRFADLEPFFKEGEDAGFTRFELNHGIDSSMLKGLEGKTITSVHEPCPADVPASVLKENDWLVSSLDEGKRRLGVDAILKSIDLAVSVGASTVVVHPGRVDSDFDGEERMRELFDSGGRAGNEYAGLMLRNREARERAAPANFRQVSRSIGELASYAGARGIVLGLENRYHFHEFPSPDELVKLLAIGPPGTVGFWYDAGHAETLSRLGFFPHREWLDRFSDRIVGAHFHDLSGLEDHRFAGNGTQPWAFIKGRIPASALRTCEFRNTCTGEEIERGRAFLEELGV